MNVRFAGILTAAALSANIFLSCAVSAAPTLGSARITRAPGYSPFDLRAPNRLGLSPADRGVAADVAVLRNGRMLGKAPDATQIHIGLLLKTQHEDELRALVAAQGDRRSAYYHHYLSSAQFTSYFAPSPATVARLQARLRLAGFRIDRTNANRTMITAIAPASIAGRYFRTSFALTQQTGRRTTYANLSPAVMPADLKGDVVSISGLHSFRTVHFDHQVESAQGRAQRRALQRAHLAPEALQAVLASRGVRAPRVALATPSPDPRPITTTTAAPGPNPTDLVETPNSDLQLVAGQGYGPPIFSVGYDYPTQHGYNGTGHAAGSVIDTDYSDADIAMELKQYALPARTPGKNEFRVCYDGTTATATTASCQLCVETGTVATNTNCDAEGESGLDAEAIMSMAPGASFYEFLAPGFSDVQLEQAYETAVAQDIVDAVNSSFGGCETDDPAFLYSADYIALEGAAEGITFAASSGDTGGESCGVYASNGIPQTFTNVSGPAAANYFTSVGGTSYDTVPRATATDYTAEQAWLEGGGGGSVIIAAAPWQTAAIAAASVANMDITTGRDVPDVAFTADGGAAFVGGTQGNGLIICSEAISGADPCDFTGSGGTSLASPLFVAMQTEINQVTKSRNGWVNPRLYAAALANPGFAFRDLTVGNNERYNAGTGYDMATGLGSPLGFELAASE